MQMVRRAPSEQRTCRYPTACTTNARQQLMAADAPRLTPDHRRRSRQQRDLRVSRGDQVRTGGVEVGVIFFADKSRSNCALDDPTSKRLLTLQLACSIFVHTVRSIGVPCA